MVAGFQLLSILLISFLIELDYCSAFPRARRSAYAEAWQGVREEQDARDFGNHQFVQSLTQSNSKLQSNDEVNSWPRPWGHSWTDGGNAQIQYQPSLYHQTQSLNQPWSASSSQPQSQVPMPKSFQFNFQVPMVNAHSQSKGDGSRIKGSTLNRGGSDHANYNPRPSSVQMQSSFNSPSVLDRFLGPKGGKKPNEVSKPSFELSLSVPISPTTPPSNPTTSTSENLMIPENDRFAGNRYIKPESVQRQTEQIYQSVNSEHTDHKVVTFSPGHAPQLPTPTEQISHGEIPAKHTWFFPAQTQYPPLSMQSWQPENIFSGQINPTVYHYWRGQSGQSVLPSPNAYLSWVPWQYDVAGRSSGNNYGQYQICHPDGTPLTFIPTYDWHKEPIPSQRPGPRSYAPFSHQYQQPSFDYGKVSATANYQMGDVMPMGQDNFFSSSHQYSLGQSGQDADPLTAFGSPQNFQGLSTKYETQMGNRVAGNPGQYIYFY